MKKIYKLLAVLSIGLFASCEFDQGDTPYLDNRDNNIFFIGESGALNVAEGVENVYTINVGSTAPAESLNYSIEVDEANSVAVEGLDFNILETVGSFDNGKVVSSIRISADFDVASTEGKTVVFNLVSEDAQTSSKQFSLDLVKLCPYEGLDTTEYTANVYAFDDEAPSFDLTLVPVSGEENQWTIYSSWGPTFVSWATGDNQYDGMFLYSGTIVLNDDFTVDVIGNDSWATGGSGSFSPCTQQFSFTLSQSLFSGSFTVDVVLSPVE